MHIMVATGTGIAPYRAYLRRMFMEDVPNYKFTGLAWLFMGVANSDATLYDDEFQEILKKYPKQVRHSGGQLLCSPSHMTSRSSLELSFAAFFCLMDVMLLCVLLTLLIQPERWLTSLYCCSSAWTMPSPASSRTRTAARCTSRTRQAYGSRSSFK